jgi:hypothetical protein
MRSSHDGSSTPVSPLDNAFSPSYLNLLRDRDDALTAAEAELAGPWKIEPVPGRPGAVAILRLWEDLALGDPRFSPAPEPLWKLRKQFRSVRNDFGSSEMVSARRKQFSRAKNSFRDSATLPRTRSAVR